MLSNSKHWNCLQIKIVFDIEWAGTFASSSWIPQRNSPVYRAIDDFVAGTECFYLIKKATQNSVQKIIWFTRRRHTKKNRKVFIAFVVVPLLLLVEKETKWGFVYMRCERSTCVCVRCVLYNTDVLPFRSTALTRSYVVRFSVARRVCIALYVFAIQWFVRIHTAPIRVCRFFQFLFDCCYYSIDVVYFCCVDITWYYFGERSRSRSRQNVEQVVYLHTIVTLLNCCTLNKGKTAQKKYTECITFVRVVCGYSIERSVKK